MKNILCSSSLFTSSNWFIFDEDKALNDVSVSSEPSPSPNSEISSPEVDDDMDEVVLSGVVDSTKDSDALLLVCNKNSDEQSGQTFLTNGPVDNLDNGIRPPTPDVKQSQPECVEWREEDAEPVDVVEKDIVDTNFEAGSENPLDAANDVKPDDAVGSSMPVATTEAVCASFSCC
jgi:serine/threonine-protein phosphatase 6 regulatory subunit 3